jgi:LysM repeat protein
MVSNQVLAARAVTGLCIVLGAVSATLAGCAHHAQRPTEAAAPAPAAVGSTAEAAPAPEPMTATEAAIQAASSPASSSAPPSSTPASTTPAEAPPPASSAGGMIKSTAPLHYTVKRGDTLWGIASMYLKDPWLWPEIWVINPQIPNPHLIYPGDQLALAYGGDGHPRVGVEQPSAARFEAAREAAGEGARLEPRLRSEPIASAIPTIPYSAIAAFLLRPTVMTSEQIRNAPYVLAFRDSHEVGGTNNEIYIRNLEANENARFAVIHIATQLRDPDDGKVVGYEGIYTATALVRRPGHPAKAVLIDPARETLRGDRLLSTDLHETPANFVPHVPASPVHGQILDVVNGADLVGTYGVVVINRGQRHGLEPGNVLAVFERGDVVRDLFRDGRRIGSPPSFPPAVTLPSERTGTMLVFKVFDRVSYALIVGASDTIHVGDQVASP